MLGRVKIFFRISSPENPLVPNEIPGVGGAPVKRLTHAMVTILTVSILPVITSVVGIEKRISRGACHYHPYHRII